MSCLRVQCLLYICVHVCTSVCVCVCVRVCNIVVIAVIEVMLRFAGKLLWERADRFTLHPPPTFPAPLFPSLGLHDFSSPSLTPLLLPLLDLHLTIPVVYHLLYSLLSTASRRVTLDLVLRVIQNMVQFKRSAWDQLPDLRYITAFIKLYNLHNEKPFPRFG